MDQESQRMSLYMKHETLDKVLVIIDEEMMLKQIDWVVNVF